MNLNQVTLPSHDVVASIDFFTRMGFELIVDARPRYARFLCPEGQSTFSVHHASPEGSRSGFTTYFECADLDASYAELRALGYEFRTPPTDQPWLWREARLEDPSGNEICLYHAGTNRVNPPWRVAAGTDRTGQ